MLTHWGSSHPFCDQVSRRDFLRAGGLGLGGLSLAGLLRGRAEAKDAPRTPRSVIMVCLAGGPSHLDMYDLKPNAPLDYRGEFKPISSNVPGFDLCEYFPLQAKIADKLALVRSLQWVEPMQHELEETYTGFPKSAHRPSLCSVISRYRGGSGKIPSNVVLDYSTAVNSYESPQYVGAAHAPLYISGSEGVRNLSLMDGMTQMRLTGRRNLLEQFDAERRRLDAARETHDLDAFTSRAFDIITSPETRLAFDLSKEPESIRQRYGRADDKFAYVGQALDSVWDSTRFLLARRLVEAGVPIVSFKIGLWDHHGNVIQGNGGTSIWANLRTSLPLLDRSIHALVTDLAERGLDREVVVLVWGEFGRTPKIDLTGRDHWPSAGFALFAGAVRTGQVIGQTDSRGELPRSRPLGPQNVIGTLYHALGIDYREKLNDFTGRPTQLLDDGEPISELVI